MKITLEPTDTPFELPDGSHGRIWQGVTEKGIPVIAVVLALGCQPEHEAAFDAEAATADLEFSGSRTIDFPDDEPKLN